MKYSLTLRKETELDLSSCFEYYENIQQGLGIQFIECVEESFNKIQQRPYLYKEILPNIRRVAISKFPYRVFYTILEKQIIVNAVFHARKDPNSWNINKRT